ncbi:monofunctional biosynthetic peptidoglycan transglycosylase [Azospirillum sp. SYSU D00513]|uniref:monofunctional biosynthetic peptidoglycan transglycosylase n=1 Tax=Azospirillum sp. SYSU D00513 TaxID=2812561 RepID=UPI001A96C638|nr:monofunctional biosynthetic peptidoglycan transglycosylase [Azospirillum sp. SYSU D00513]
MRVSGRRLMRIAALAVLALVAVSVGAAVLYRFLPVPVTPFMLVRAVGGSGIDKDWVPLTEISPQLVRAVIASEDAKFCDHLGFDWAAIEGAFAAIEDGGRLRGGSTISQQTAKNVFLWQDRTWIRKGAEAYFTLLIETLWSKRRIMEVYLNVIEWDDGVYGAEAAARHHFGKSAATLSRREAALLAVVLPSPRNWSAGKPGPYVSRRAGVIERRMGVVESDRLDDCAG